MNIWFYMAVHDAAAFAAGAFLIYSGHPWWGALCFVLAATTTVTTTRTPATQEDNP
jgi:hypothetical protein